jgi:hypothetical protein
VKIFLNFSPAIEPLKPNQLALRASFLTLLFDGCKKQRNYVVPVVLFHYDILGPTVL